MSIIVTGAAGQIGTELLIALRQRYPSQTIIGIGHKTPPSSIINETTPGPFHMNINISNKKSLESIFIKYPNIHTIYHMAAILSGIGEQNPLLCWNININGTINLLELCKKYNIKNILIPSSIAAFGPNTKNIAPQNGPMNPTSIYGVTKVSCELLCEYYNKKYNMNIRGLRLPGIISYKAMPGGGTTDYAIEIFYNALINKKYTCFLLKNEKLPMMYMPDCINSMIKLMEYNGKLTRMTDFNINAFSFDCEMLSNEIKKYIPELIVKYKPDYRQNIAHSWPSYIDDSVARKEWGWKEEYTFEKMVKDMIYQIKLRYKKTGDYYPKKDVVSKL